MEDRCLSACKLGILDALSDDAIHEIVESYNGFCAATETLLNGAGDLSVGSEFVVYVHGLCKHGVESLVREHFLRALEVRNFHCLSHFLIVSGKGMIFLPFRKLGHISSVSTFGGTSCFVTGNV